MGGKPTFSPRSGQVLVTWQLPMTSIENMSARLSTTSRGIPIRGGYELFERRGVRIEACFWVVHADPNIEVIGRASFEAFHNFAVSCCAPAQDLRVVRPIMVHSRRDGSTHFEQFQSDQRCV